jgi:hypothetical protein
LCSIRQLAKLANFIVRQLPYFQRVTVGNWFAFLTASEDAPTIKRGKMLRIRRSANAQVVFRLSGRMGLEETVELETLIKSEENGRPIVLDLKDVTLVHTSASGSRDSEKVVSN